MTQFMYDDIRKLIEFFESSPPIMAKAGDITYNIRNDILPLCTEIRRLDAEVERLKAELKSARSYSSSDFIDL